MPRYEVHVVTRPEVWCAGRADDVPPTLGLWIECLGQFEWLISAVQRAIEFNQHPDRQSDDRWAVVVDPETVGRRFDRGRLCTPLRYRVASIWWPSGWEPTDPLDVPDCVLHAQSDPHAESCTYERALRLVRALNRQCMDSVSAYWYVVVAEEAEPLSRSINFDPAGVETTVEVKRFHVVRPDPSARGTCTDCPACELNCATGQWSSFPTDIPSRVG